MKHLSEYVFENLINEAKSQSKSYIYTYNLQLSFKDVIDNELLNNIERDTYIDCVCKMTGKTGDELEEFIGICYDAWKNNDFTPYNVPFRFNASRKCKLARIYEEILTKEQINKGQEIRSKYKIFATDAKNGLFGDGSIGAEGDDVPTEAQENGTCAVWNKMVEQSREDHFDINDINTIKSTVESIFPSFTKTWLASFQKQCIALSNFLKQDKDIGENQINLYKAIRYDTQDTIGSIYAGFINKYITITEKEYSSSDKEIKSIPKDNYDPSDIILYKTDKHGEPLSEIKTAFTELNAEADRISSMDQAEMDKENITSKSNHLNKLFRDKLFNKKLVIGVSLKKITGVKNTGKAEYFNIEVGKETIDIKSITSIKDVTGKKSKTINGANVTLRGTFNFSGVSDVTDNPEEGNTIDENEIVLRLRTNGDKESSIQFDCKMGNGPSLGKVPVRRWDGFFVDDNNNKIAARRSNIVELSNAFIKFATEAKDNGDTEKINQLKDWIKWAIKNGPWCMPFALVH